MIPIDTLKAVTTVVSHQNCADGTASALILKDVLPHAEFLFMQYNTAELLALEPKPHMLFVDFSPPAKSAAEFVKAGAICLDHHKTAKSVVESFGDLGVYAAEDTQPGVSGAVLAMREVWLPMARAAHQTVAEALADGRQLPPDTHLYGFMFWDRLARLAGIYDTWQREHVLWEEALAQAEALRWWPWTWMKGNHPPAYLAGKLELGRPLVEKKTEEVDKALKRAYRFATTKGTRVTVFQGTDVTNDAADAAGDATDLVMGFRYEHDGLGSDGKLIWSCRTRGRYDVGALAKHYGGGGHTGAAGFSVKVATYSPQPFMAARLLVNAYETGETLIGGMV